MKRSSVLGFTLIELLTVIAIIAILAAITLVAGPRLIEMAKKRSLDATMNELRTQLAQYFVDHGTYPPRYGYVDRDALALWQQNNAPGTPMPPEMTRYVHYLKPYLAYLGLHKNEDFYDNFSEGYDADRDGQISLLEYSPIGRYNAATDRYDLDYDGRALYDGVTPDEETQQMLKDERARRPLIYVPVEMRQFNKMREFWIDSGEFYAESYDPNNPDQPSMVFPPVKYDAFVLISVGPAGDTFGITNRADAAAYANALAFERFKYHILGLRTFFLATRDLNNNFTLDFHYEARRKGEASVGQFPVEGTSYTANNNLPDPRAPLGYGPYIYVYK